MFIHNITPTPKDKDITVTMPLSHYIWLSEELQDAQKELDKARLELEALTNAAAERT